MRTLMSDMLKISKKALAALDLLRFLASLQMLGSSDELTEDIP